MSRTYASMEVSHVAFQEVRSKLIDAGYEHAVHDDENTVTLDMYGIALVTPNPDEPLPEPDITHADIEEYRMTIAASDPSTVSIETGKLTDLMSLAALALDSINSK